MSTLLDEIKAKVGLAVRDSQDTLAVTGALNVGRVRVRARIGGIGLVLEQLGPTAGAELLDALETLASSTSAIKWALILVNRGELDFGSPATREMIDTLVAGGDMTMEQADALKGIAEIPDPISELDVRQVCFSDTGEWLA